MWRKFAEKIPEKSGLYIVFAKSMDPEMPLKLAVWWFADRQEWGLVEHWKNAVTHWMPLPDDPEEVPNG